MTDLTGGTEYATRPQRLASDAPLLFFCCRPDGTRHCRSFLWEQYTRQSEQESLAFGWLQAIHSDDRGITLEAWSTASVNGEHIVEHRIWQGASEGYRWHQTRAAPLRTDDALEWVGISTDFHDRQQTQDRLRETERQLRTLVEGVPLLLWRSCDQGKWTWASPQWLEYTGQTQEDTHGRGWLKPVHVDDREAAVAAWERARGTGFVDVEFRLRRAVDGAYLYHRTLSKPLFDEQGRMIEWLGVTTDIQHLKDHAAGLAREIQEREIVEQRLSFIAFHDDLTKLRSRQFFVERLGQLINLASERPICSCAVLFFDLDRFKLVNDSLGHQAGDRLLVEIADRLRSCIGPTDTLARFGGDEFAILVEDGPATERPMELAACIIEAVEKPAWIEGHEVFSSCSIGVVKQANHVDPAGLLRDADIALYRAKARCGGSYVVFEPSMRTAAVEALELRTDLQNAIDRGELVLNYQPICSAHDGQVTGAEALVRWQHPTRGLLPPDMFITLAEETGLIRAIGQFVLNEACRQMQLWQQGSMKGRLRLSVNASGQEINDPRYVENLAELLLRSGLPPQCLEIEVTESVFLERPDTIGEVLRRIRALGVRVALDDFGTGYSSLSYLDKFEVNTVKIDRSFVARMLGHERTLAIIRTIVRLGQDLDFDIVAEGVEEDAQFLALQAAGCKSVQGFLLGHPISASAFTRCFIDDH